MPPNLKRNTLTSRNSISIWHLECVNSFGSKQCPPQPGTLPLLQFRISRPERYLFLFNVTHHPYDGKDDVKEGSLRRTLKEAVATCTCTGTSRKQGKTRGSCREPEFFGLDSLYPDVTRFCTLRSSSVKRMTSWTYHETLKSDYYSKIWFMKHWIIRKGNTNWEFTKTINIISLFQIQAVPTPYLSKSSKSLMG
jgi:hypothetical protein